MWIRAAAQVETSKANIAALRTKRDIAQNELSYAQLTAPLMANRRPLVGTYHRRKHPDVSRRVDVAR